MTVLNVRKILLTALTVTSAAGATYAIDSTQNDLAPAGSTYRVILDPKHKTLLSAEVTATVKKVTKKMGEPFEKDELLIQLDDTIHRARVLEAEAALEKARTERDATQQLFDDEVASLVELKETEAQYAAAEAQQIVAQKRFDSCTIEGPYRGKVVDLSFEEHELVQPGDALIETVDDTVLVAKLLIPSTTLPSVSLGKVIYIEVMETRTKEPAVIKRIGAIIDAASSTIKVDAEIDNSDGHLRAGMMGTTTLED